jgi:nucleotide-binding universal stress UspA family protein
METPKTLLLHVDDSDACIDNARTVQRLAERFEARAMALYAVTPSAARYPAAAAIDSAWTIADRLGQVDDEQRARAKSRFVTAQKALPRVRWCDPVKLTAWDLPRQAMYADLVVMRGAKPTFNELPLDFPATVAIESGRPVLVLPAKPPEEIGTTVLLAWKPSPEAARAMAAAIPWLKRARKVHIVTGQTHDDSGAASVVGITDYLSGHGIECDRAPSIADTLDAGPALRSLAADVAADLLVMGCYGHSRAREWLLGGTTRSMTREPDIPVLMAH